MDMSEILSKGNLCEQKTPLDQGRISIFPLDPSLKTKLLLQVLQKQHVFQSSNFANRLLKHYDPLRSLITSCAPQPTSSNKGGKIFNFPDTNQVISL